MRSFVATIFDLGSAEEPHDPFALPSSVVNDGSDTYRPAKCENPAGFGFVIPGHRYDAEVEAYDRTDLKAVGLGSRYLVDENTGEYVQPRWTTTCGRKADGSPAEGPVTSAIFLTRFVRGCAPLESHAPETPTGISVSLENSLGELECGEGVEQVSHFTVELDGSGKTPEGAACGESVEFVDLDPERSYTLSVLAFEKDATTPRWSTSCFRTTQQGAVVPASCDPLSELPLQSSTKER